MDRRRIVIKKHIYEKLPAVGVFKTIFEKKRTRLIKFICFSLFFVVLVQPFTIFFTIFLENFAINVFLRFHHFTITIFIVTSMHGQCVTREYTYRNGEYVYLHFSMCRQ